MARHDVERDRFALRAALKAYDAARNQKTSFERILEDDGDDLPGANAAQPTCPFCKGHFYRRRKDQLYCGTLCRQAAFKARRAMTERASPQR